MWHYVSSAGYLHLVLAVIALAAKAQAQVARALSQQALVLGLLPAGKERQESQPTVQLTVNNKMLNRFYAYLYFQSEMWGFSLMWHYVSSAGYLHLVLAVIALAAKAQAQVARALSQQALVRGLLPAGKERQESQPTIQLTVTQQNAK